MACIDALALISLALAVGFLLAACGSDKVAVDPLVGTWRELGDETPTSSSPPLIITKAQGGYVATFVYWGGGDETPASPRPTLALPMTRQGDRLVGVFRGTDNVTFGAEIVYLPDSGRLTWANSRIGDADGPLNEPHTWTKVSPGTAYPTTL